MLASKGISGLLFLLMMFFVVSLKYSVPGLEAFLSGLQEIRSIVSKRFGGFDAVPRPFIVLPGLLMTVGDNVDGGRSMFLKRPVFLYRAMFH